MDSTPDRSLMELAASFMEMGRDGVEPSPSRLGDSGRVTRRLLCGNSPWRSLAGSLADEDLRDLIRGMVRYSRAIGSGIGGSVSPVIVLYRELVARSPEWEPEFTSWVVRHRMNPWEPFGTRNDGHATTLRAFKSHGATCAEANARRHEAGLERQAADQAAKRERDRKESTERIAAAIRRGDRDAVVALLKKNPDLKAALPHGGSLVDLAVAHEKPEIAAILREHETP